jgi:hypothetical protein
MISSVQFRKERIFTLLLAAAALIQSAGGLFLPNLYRDQRWVVSIYRGTDLVTLALVVPALIGSMLLAVRGSNRARLVWIGILFYIFYNNLYFLLATAFNRLFLVYVAIAILSAWTLVEALLHLDAGRICAKAGPSGPGKAAGAVLFACATILLAMWVGQGLDMMIRGRIPGILSDAGGTTHPVAALDLTLIVPFLYAGSVLLWKSRPWGHVLSAVMSVQCFIIALVLVVAAPFQAAWGIPNSWTFFPLWAGMAAGFLFSAVATLRNMTARSVSAGSTDPPSA